MAGGLTIPNLTHWPLVLPEATDTSDGVMSAADKATIDAAGIPIGWVNVKNAPYNAKGDGVSDDTAAIAAAYAATPAGGTMFLPPGKYKITSTLTFNRPVSIEGLGIASYFWIALADTTKPGIVIGAPYATSNVQYQTFRNFSVQGATGSCINGLAVYQADRCRFQNVQVRPGSTQQAVVVAGCLISYFNFIVSDEGFGGIYDPSAGDWNGAAVLVADLRNGTPIAPYPGGSVMPTNACVFDVVLEGGNTTGGLCMEAQDQAGGNNVFTGTFEGFQNSGASAVKGAGYTIKIEGGIGWTIREVHAELSQNGCAINNSQKFSIHDGIFAPIPSEAVTITNSTDFFLADNSFGTLSIDTTNARWNVRRCLGGLSGYTQSLTNESTLESYFYSSSNNAYRLSGLGQDGQGTLFPSGNLVRWPLSSAEMSFIGNNPTLTLCGEGLGDTTQRFYSHSVKVQGVDQTYVLYMPLPHAARYFTQPVTIWVDIKNTGATDIDVGVYNSAAFNLHGIAKAGSGWQRIGLTVTPTGTDFGIALRAHTNAAYTYYLGGFGGAIGDTMPVGIEAPFPSFSDGILLASQKITVGTAAPTTGTWAVGDLVINSAPSASTPFGWICTVAGTPGTWVTYSFASLDNATSYGSTANNASWKHPITFYFPQTTQFLISSPAADVAGNNLFFTAGAAGAVSAAAGKAAGNIQLAGAAGVAGTAGLAAGPGGNFSGLGGNAGTNNGGGGNNGGNSTLRGGAGTGAGVNGNVVLGDTNTANVNLGGSGNPNINVANGSSNKLGFFATTAVAQQTSAGNTHTVAAGSTTSVFTNTTFDGSTGATAYTIGDIVKALKAYGLLAS